MRLVEWIDGAGFIRRSMIKDTDSDEAKGGGLPQGPPDLQQMDWDAIVRSIHNDMMKAGLYTWQDVSDSQNGMTAIVNRRVRRPLIAFIRNGGVTNE